MPGEQGPSDAELKAGRLRTSHELMAGGAELDEIPEGGLVLRPTKEQVEQARREMAADARSRLDAATAEKPAESEAAASVEDLVDPETRERISGIVDSITDARLLGKFRTGTTLRVGDLPPVTATGTAMDDFGVYGGPRNQGLGKIMTSLKPAFDAMRRDARPSPGPNRQLLYFQDLKPTEKGTPALVAYALEQDHRDEFGRGGEKDLAAIGLLMPSQSAHELRRLVEANPDAAEAFFQQVAPGLEPPPGSDASTPGVPRYKSPGVTVVDGAKMYGLLHQRGAQRFKLTAGELAGVATDLSYRRPHGSVEAPAPRR